MSDFRCLVCDSTDKWKNVDEFRDAKKGMHICMNCGFVSYPNRFKDNQDAKKYYDKDYRPPPNHGNLQTGQRKIQGHAAFLKDLFDQWKKEGKEAPVVSDIGAAYGMYLHWVKTQFPEADVTGTEFTEAYRRNAWHEYKIELTKDFDDSKKYDLISSYKVAEHQVDADKFLRQYAESLTEDGLVYVSVPTWFESMLNPGTDDWDLEYYYHPDHINVWTRNLFEQVLKKAGLEVIKYDGIIYGDTYLCKRNDDLMKEELQFEDPEKIIATMKAIQAADNFYKAGKYEEAVKAFPDFPKGWVLNYESNRAKAHKDQGKMPWDFVKETYLLPAMEACGDDVIVLRFCADISMRYGKYKDAFKLLERGLELKPNNAVFLAMLAQCYRDQGEMAEKVEERDALYTRARDISRFIRQIDFSMQNDCINWIYSDNAKLSTPNEH